MDHIKLNAFNLIPGATFSEGYEGDSSSPVWTVVTVHRDSNRETVHAWVRRADQIIEGPGDITETKMLAFDYCDKVALVGLTVNAGDPDDNDWGN